MKNKLRCSTGVLERLFEKTFLEFLGSGSAFESENTTAYFIEGDTLVLVDTGELNTHKINELLRTSTKIERVEIIITHMHMDHVGGLSTVLYYIHYKLPYIKEVNVIVGEGVEIEKYLKISGITDEVFDTSKSLFIVNNECSVLVHNGDGCYVEVTFHKNVHVSTMDSYSLVFTKRMLDRNKSAKDRTVFYSGDSACILKGAQKLGFIDEWYQDVSNVDTTAHLGVTAFLNETLWMNRPTKTFGIHNTAFEPTVELLSLDRLLDIQADTTKAFCAVEVPITIKADDIFIANPGIGESEKLKDFRKFCTVIPIEHFPISKDVGYVMVKVYCNFKLIALSVIKYFEGRYGRTTTNVFTINTNPDANCLLEEFGCIELEEDYMVYGKNWSGKAIKELHNELAKEIFNYRKGLN